MATGKKWTREELKLALNLYSRLPFGRLHSHNPDIICLAEHLGRTAGSVAMKLGNFAAIDPDLERTGLRSYSRLDAEIWHEYFASEEMMLEADRQVQAILHGTAPVVETIVDYSARDATANVNVRTHQHIFREIVLSNFSDTCCVTGINQSELLVASHIKPWAADMGNRLNPHNGLCLNALHDKAFDRGLITLDESLKVVISPKLPRITQLSFILDYEGHLITRPEKFMPDKTFLDYHREHIFRAG